MDLSLRCGVWSGSRGKRKKSGEVVGSRKISDLVVFYIDRNHLTLWTFLLCGVNVTDLSTRKEIFPAVPDSKKALRLQSTRVNWLVSRSLRSWTWSLHWNNRRSRHSLHPATLDVLIDPTWQSDQSGLGRKAASHHTGPVVASQKARDEKIEATRLESRRQTRHWTQLCANSKGGFRRDYISVSCIYLRFSLTSFETLNLSSSWNEYVTKLNEKTWPLWTQMPFSNHECPEMNLKQLLHYWEITWSISVRCSGAATEICWLSMTSKLSL